jgi:hypothetical protein
MTNKEAGPEKTRGLSGLLLAFLGGTLLNSIFRH